ncbi:MAG: CPBP family intramembrane metalloprotease [Planctomycetota bacterium]|nr:CPBP family intramembrane metalloprotease [Planctomycetota bacterium]
MDEFDALPAPDEQCLRTWVAVVFEGSLAVIAGLIGWWLGRSPLVGITWSWEAGPDQAAAALAGAAAALPMLLGLALVERYPLGPLQELKDFMDRCVVPLFRQTSVWQLALIASVAGVGEELFFRGLLQHALTEQIGAPYGVWIGLVAASTVFGVCHWLTHTYAVLAGLIGVYLGALLLLTGNVLAPIVAHGLYDFVALVYLVRNADQPLERDVG